MDCNPCSDRTLTPKTKRTIWVADARRQLSLLRQLVKFIMVITVPETRNIISAVGQRGEGAVDSQFHCEFPICWSERRMRYRFIERNGSAFTFLKSRLRRGEIRRTARHQSSARSRSLWAYTVNMMKPPVLP